MIYSIKEVVDILSDYGITNSIHSVRQWIREGRLAASYLEPNNRKLGKVVSQEQLYEFLQKVAPRTYTLIQQHDALYIENVALKEEIQRLKRTSEEISTEVSSKKANGEGNVIYITEKDVHRPSYISYKKKKAMVKFLFRDVKPGDKKKIILEKGKTFNIFSYLKKLSNSEEFNVFLQQEEGNEPKTPVKKEKKGENISFLRSDIQKMKGINKYDKEKLINYLFQDVPKGKKATVSLEEGQTIEHYFNNLLKDADFKFFNLDENGKENFIREKRGEMSITMAEKMCEDIVIKNQLRRERGLVAGADERLITKHLIPALVGNKKKIWFTNLKRDDVFINPFTDETFPTIEEAISSSLFYVFSDEFIDKVDVKW